MQRASDVYVPTGVDVCDKRIYPFPASVHVTTSFKILGSVAGPGTHVPRVMLPRHQGLSGARRVKVDARV